MDRTRRAIREMLAVGDQEVWKLRPDGSQVKVPLESIAVGDRVAAHLGEKISVDGIVERGEARRAKDFARADRLREQLRAAGVEIMDTPQGTTWRRA
jgi:cysteinyl-tRNA synthetase